MQQMNPHLQKLQRLLLGHAVIQHPYLQKFRAGEWNKKQIRVWFEQQMHFSVALPACFAALYARIPDRYWVEKRKLVDLLNVEAWGASDPECHSHYFKEFADFLGMDIDQVSKAEPKEYTKDYVHLRFDLCLHKPIVQGLAGIAFGNEMLNLFIFQVYREGIHKISGLEQCPSEYFEVHLRDEASDFQVFAKLLETLVAHEADWEEAEKGLKELLDARVVFFDRLCEDLDKVLP